MIQDSQYVICQERVNYAFCLMKKCLINSPTYKFLFGNPLNPDILIIVDCLLRSVKSRQRIVFVYVKQKSITIKGGLSTLIQVYIFYSIYGQGVVNDWFPFFLYVQSIGSCVRIGIIVVENIPPFPSSQSGRCT